MSDLYVSLSGPLTSSLSLTPVQSAAWSEQQQQEHREEISKKPLERSNVSFSLTLATFPMPASARGHIPLFLSPVGVGAQRCVALVERLEASALGGCGCCSRAVHQG